MGNHTYRVIERTEREALHGKEYQGRVEVVCPDGSKESKPYFERTVEFDDSCVQVSWHILPQVGPVTIVKSIRMGRIEGGTRRDHVQVTMILPDGTVHRMPEADIARPMANPLAGKSPQEAVDHVHQYVNDLLDGMGELATPEDAIRAVEEFKRRRYGLEPKK